jgi:hypothetical protein
VSRRGAIAGSVWLALVIALRAAELALPPRPAGALTGSEFATRFATAEIAAREAAIVDQVRQGNVPAWWRRFVALQLDGGVVCYVAPDYLAVGSDEDYLFTPLTPAAAQTLADALDCVLPTTKLVDAIHHAAAVKLEPAPIAPSAAMTTLAVFAEHNAIVRQQRVATLAAHPAGALVAGDKKDIVISPRLALSPGKVAIYGWHRSDGKPIQPLFLGHAATWVDYSHGVRLVQRAILLNGAPITIDAMLADEKRAALLSDEGSIAVARYGERPALTSPRPQFAERNEEFRIEPGVRIVINAPDVMDAARPTRLVLFGAPAGNTIEQTFGRRMQPGDDWHFDIQHLAAQTRWLRRHDASVNLVVACLQTDERSWVAWRRKYADAPVRIMAVVDALRARFPGARLVLTGHSAGGTLTFGYCDAVDEIPSDIERIAFLDSNYAYDAAKGHATKLAHWLAAAADRRLCVLAYEDFVALLDGKTFVSEAGGTWGRSQAMLRDLGAIMPFARADTNGLQRHAALAGRVQFFLKENPEKAILHTRQVELNGFIHAMLVGTPAENAGYVYLGARVYSDLIADR